MTALRGGWFQPTLPLRGATKRRRPISRTAGFQPTLPLRGATITAHMLQTKAEFQPTLPLRGATSSRVGVGRHVLVSTHAPLAGSDPSWSV